MFALYRNASQVNLCKGISEAAPFIDFKAAEPLEVMALVDKKMRFHIRRTYHRMSRKPSTFPVTGLRAMIPRARPSMTDQAFRNVYNLTVPLPTCLLNAE